MMKVSVVIPVFQDADALPELVSRLLAMGTSAGIQLEIIVVDDGSDDEVWEQEKALRAAFPDAHLTLMRMASNHGQSLATLQGLLRAGGDYLVTLDADLQHVPEFIPAMLATLRQSSPELVYASNRHGHGWGRRFVGTLRRLLVAPLGTSLASASSFRAIDGAFFRRHIKPRSEHIYSLDEALSWFARDFTRLENPHLPRKYNASSYSTRRILGFAVRSAYYSRHLPRALFIAALALFVTGLLAMRPEHDWRSSPAAILLVALGAITALASLAARLLSHRRRPASGIVLREVLQNARVNDQATPE